MQPLRPRRAVTAAELVVALAAAALLLGLLLPAVHAARGRAEQAQQKNNLKQIGIALHNTHAVYKKMPPAVGPFGGKTSASIHFHLLPYIEQENVYKDDATGTVIPLYVDDKDVGAPNGNKFQNQWPTTNYAANWLVFKDGPGGGARFVQIRDGTSNTIAFAERYQVCNDTPTVWSYDQVYYWAPMFAYYHQGKFQVVPEQRDCDPALPQALRKEGILVLLMDGSTRVVAPSVSGRTWWHACHPADGNLLGADWEN